MGAMSVLLTLLLRLALPPCSTAAEDRFRCGAWQYGWATVCLDAWVGIRDMLDDVCADFQDTIERHGLDPNEYPDGCP